MMPKHALIFNMSLIIRYKELGEHTYGMFCIKRSSNAKRFIIRGVESLYVNRLDAKTRSFGSSVIMGNIIFLGRAL